MKHLKHVGVLGMRWGKRKNPLSRLNDARKESALRAQKKDVDSLEKHGFIKEAAAVKANRINSLKTKKLSDLGKDKKKKEAMKIVAELVATGGLLALNYGISKYTASKVFGPKTNFKRIPPAAGLIIDAVFKK